MEATEKIKYLERRLTQEIVNLRKTEILEHKAKYAKTIERLAGQINKIYKTK